MLSHGQTHYGFLLDPLAGCFPEEDNKWLVYVIQKTTELSRLLQGFYQILVESSMDDPEDSTIAFFINQDKEGKERKGVEM